MAVKSFTFILPAVMHDEDPRYWELSGLYCRTQNSV